MDLHFTFSVKNDAECRIFAQQLAAWARSKGVAITKGKVDSGKSISFSSHKEVASIGVDQVKRAEVRQKRKTFAMSKMSDLPKTQLQKMAQRKGIATSINDGKSILLAKLTRNVDKQNI